MAGDHDQLRKIARLYYIEDKNQREIAARMGMSVASVSRSITRARELGIVRITIEDAPDDHHSLELAIEKRFGLRECVVTPSFERPGNTHRAYAGALATVLPRLLPRDALVGVSWGETLKALGEELSGVESLQADVIPVIGAMGTIETGIYPNSIARTFAEKLGGRAWLVNAPAVLDSAETARRLMDDSTFDPVRERWQRLDCAILGASAVDEKTSVFRGGIFTRDELKALRDAGVTAATNFLFLDRDGSVCPNPLGERIVCLPRAAMERIPAVVIVAGGAEKIAAITATLRSGLAHVLITDEETARVLERGAA